MGFLGHVGDDLGLYIQIQIFKWNYPSTIPVKERRLNATVLTVSMITLVITLRATPYRFRQLICNASLRWAIPQVVARNKFFSESQKYTLDLQILFSGFFSRMLISAAVLDGTGRCAAGHGTSTAIQIRLNGYNGKITCIASVKEAFM